MKDSFCQEVASEDQIVNGIILTSQFVCCIRTFVRVDTKQTGIRKQEVSMIEGLSRRVHMNP